MTTAPAEEIDLANDDLYAPDAAEDAAGGAPFEPGPDTITDEAPFGYTRDPAAPGGWRPKKAAGRPRIPRSAAELAAEPEPEPRPPDEAPRPGSGPAPLADDDVPMPKGGTIARQANRLYRRVGRVVRKLDYDIGTAIIECTKAEEPDDVTVGQAWEELCRTNVRIRRFVLGFLKGGAWQDLAMAHAPIVAAIFAKEWVLKHIPFFDLIAGWFERDDDDGGQADDDDRPTLEPGDLAAMRDVTEATMRQAAERAGGGVTIQRLARKLADGSATEEDLEHLDPNLVAAAQSLAHKGVPPGFRRQQPKRGGSRAKRRH